MKFHRIPEASSSAMAALTLAAVASLLSACSSMRQPDASAKSAGPTASAAVPAVAPPPAPAEKPAARLPTAGEAALADGLKAYQAGKYRVAEAQFKTALKAGLEAPADQVNAHKHLAFIYCTSKRHNLCAGAFKNAKAVDPHFALTKAEAGHPMWAKTYRKALGIK